MDKSSGLIRIPVIVTADDDDVVNINDVLFGGYDSARDTKREVQLKRILARRLPEGLFQKEGNKKGIDAFNRVSLACAGLVEGAYNDIQRGFEIVSKCLSSSGGEPEVSVGVIHDILNCLRGARDKLLKTNSSLADVISRYGLENSKEELYEMIWVSLDTILVQMDVLTRFENGELPINGDYSYLYDLKQDLMGVRGALADFLRDLRENKYQDSPTYSINKHIYNDLDKWFPYSSSKTYSDERLKDISKALSSDGCCDIKLHDNHVKAITDDFRKWLSDSDDKSAILSGIKELGQ